MPFSGWWLEHTTRNRVFCRWNNVIMSTKSPRWSWILVTCVVLHDITAVVTDYWQRNVGHQAQGPSNWGWQTSNSLKLGDGFEGPGVCATFYVLAWSLRGRSGREVSWLITKCSEVRPCFLSELVVFAACSIKPGGWKYSLTSLLQALLFSRYLRCAANFTKATRLKICLIDCRFSFSPRVPAEHSTFWHALIL